MGTGGAGGAACVARPAAGWPVLAFTCEEEGLEQPWRDVWTR